MFPQVWDNVSWKIKEGTTSCWHDRWLLYGPLYPLGTTIISNLLLRVRDCWIDNAWNGEPLEKLVGREMTEMIIKKIIVGREAPNVSI